MKAESVMDRKPVSSSNIDSIGYDEPTRRLHVAFKGSNRVYEFQDVPPDAHQALMSAPSIGSHFAAHVKNRYQGTKL